MKLPRITVVTPSYNQGIYLEATIRSILSQGYAGLEYAIIDGGSTDESHPIIKKYSRHLAYWISERDGGQADALAKGFAATTGEIMGWVNSDDLLAKGALAYVGRIFAFHPEVDFVSGGGAYMSSNGRLDALRHGLVTRGASLSSKRLLYYEQDGLFQPSIFWRRSLYLRAGGIDSGWKFIMDRDLFYRFARIAEAPRRTSRILSYFRIHPESKSVCSQEVRKAEVVRFQARYLPRSDVRTPEGAWLAFRLGSLSQKVLPYLGYRLGWSALPKCHQDYIDAIQKSS